MVKNALCVLLGLVLLCSSLPVIAQEGSKKQEKKGSSAKQDRWEGMVVRSSKEKSELTVRKRGTSQEKQVVYDSSTKLTAQEHGSKKVTPIEASDIKDGDRVIALGKIDDKGVLHATLISKRLTK